MAGNVCAYYLCGKSSRRTPGLRRFTFPVNDSERCEKWILNAGRLRFLLLTWHYLCPFKNNIKSRPNHNAIIKLIIDSTEAKLKMFNEKRALIIHI